MPEKNKISTSLIPCLLLLCLCLGPGCATRTPTMESAPVPGPAYQDLSTTASPGLETVKDIRQRSFLKPLFKGDLGDKVSLYTAQYLVQAESGLSLAPSKDLNPETIDRGEFFPIANVNMIIVGQVKTSVQDERGSDLVTVQEGTGQFKTDNSLFEKEKTVEIKRSVMKPVPAIIRKASLNIDFRVLKGETGKTLLEDSVHEVLEDKYGGNLEYKNFSDHRLCDLPSREDCLDFLAQKASEKIARKILGLQ